MTKTTYLPLIALACITTGCAVPGAEQEISEREAIGQQEYWLFEKEVVELEDAGELCLLDGGGDARFDGIEGGAQTLVEGNRVRFRVAVPGCLSSSCDVSREAHCAVKTKGNTLIVESYLAYNAMERESCTMDCGKLFATCESEPLELGQYEVVHGDQIRSLTVPSTFDACSDNHCEHDDDCSGDTYCDETANLCIPYD